MLQTLFILKINTNLFSKVINICDLPLISAGIICLWCYTPTSGLKMTLVPSKAMVRRLRWHLVLKVATTLVTMMSSASSLLESMRKCAEQQGDHRGRSSYTLATIIIITITITTISWTEKNRRQAVKY